MPKDCALELLSPEIQQQILLHLDSLNTLYSLICASPRLYQVFRLSKEPILSTLALCHFHLSVQSEAVAVAKLEQLPHQSKRNTAMSLCDLFPDQIHGWCESNALGPWATDLCKLHGTISFFLDDYLRNTLPVLHQIGVSQDFEILPEYPSNNHIPHPQLSSTERGKLQRAFCRFELYRKLFSRCSQKLDRDTHECFNFSPVTAVEQAEMFLRDLPAFQIVEITCIRDYLFRRLRGVFDELENEAVRTLPVEALTFIGFDEGAMWRSPFYMFTNHALHLQEDHIEHLMSMGLPFIRRILESTGDEQRDLFLHHERPFVVSHLERDFLSKGLQCLGVRTDAIDDYNPRKYDENAYSESPPTGWLWGHRLQPPKIADHVYKGLRDWGYVFWDHNRLLASGVLYRE